MILDESILGQFHTEREKPLPSNKEAFTGNLLQR